MELPRTLQNKIVEFLKSLPTLHDGESQRAFIYQAGLDPELQAQIPFGKPLSQFVPLLVSILINYGRLNDGRYALETVLETAKNCVGQDKKTYCETLLQELHTTSKEYSQVSPKNEINKIERDNTKGGQAKEVKQHQKVFLWLFLFLLIGGGYILSIWYGQQTPEPILQPFEENKLGILIATFEGVTKEEAEKGKKVQHKIESILNARFNELAIYNAEARKIPSSIVSCLNTHKQARKIGEHYNAEVVIWGDITEEAVIPNITIVHRHPEVALIIKPETTIMKNTLSHIALTKIQDIRLPPLTDEPTLLVSFMTGLQYFREREYEKALTYFDISLPKNPTKYIDSTFIFAYIAVVYYSLEDYDKAITYYEKALELNPKFIEGYINRGVSYFFQGKYDQAIDDYNKALEFDLGVVEVYLNRGVFYFFQENYDQAIDDYNKALEFEPDNPEIYYRNRGLAYNKKGEHDLAIADFNKALEFNPQFVGVYLNRALAYRDKKDYKQAIADLDRVLRINSEYGKAY